MSILPLFMQHSRSWRENRYVYPVISRRSKGLSIGVNLNPDKVCNFDCVYCCVDRTTPEGEPTSCPKLMGAARLAVELLEKHQQRDVKIVVITNATLFHQKRVAEALAYLDEHNGEIWARLDAGTEGYYREIERTSIPLAR